MKKVLLIVILTSFYFISVQAQDRNYTHRGSFWTETNFNGTIKRNSEGKALWQYSLDYQNRRMADASNVPNPNKNIFKDPYQQVFRPWVHYWIKPGSIRLSLSPVGYWMTWTPPAESEGVRKFYPEYRISSQLTFVNKYGRLEIQNRYRYEFRWIGSKTDVSKVSFLDFKHGQPFVDNPSNKMRFRYMIKFQIPLNHATMEKNTWYLAAWDELFLGFGKHTGSKGLLDQNRAIFLLGYKFNTEVPIRLEVGYTSQQANNYTYYNPDNYSHNIQLNNALQVYLVFDEFQDFFKGKKAKIK